MLLLTIPMYFVIAARGGEVMAVDLQWKTRSAAVVIPRYSVRSADAQPWHERSKALSASAERAVHRYQRHQPEYTPLHLIVEEHLPILTDQLENHHQEVEALEFIS